MPGKVTGRIYTVVDAWKKTRNAALTLVCVPLQTWGWHCIFPNDARGFIAQREDAALIGKVERAQLAGTAAELPAAVLDNPPLVVSLQPSDDGCELFD